MNQTQQVNQIRPATAKLVARLLAPLLDSGLVTNAEYNIITSNLNHLAKHGEKSPDSPPRLISGKEAAEMLGIAFSQFRSLLAEGCFPFHKKHVGGKTVRYYYPDIVAYMEASDSDVESLEKKSF